MGMYEAKSKKPFKTPFNTCFLYLYLSGKTQEYIRTPSGTDLDLPGPYCISPKLNSLLFSDLAMLFRDFLPIDVYTHKGCVFLGRLRAKAHPI
ncbi:hypothetical protein MITS9509_01349 [Synechococcus sp. MIT S9509]|nr:hypothetical protein MITS9509_01349 [Synechococcus sp. MIT S9509]